MRVLAQITYNDSSRSFEGPNEDGFKKHLDSYVCKFYTYFDPRFWQINSQVSTYIFMLSIYNVSDIVTR